MVRDDYALFAAIVAAGSLSAAGRQLGLSPAMMSKRLARLERRLGARLVQRTTRHMVLTDVGRLFHDRVVGILDAAREAEALVAGRAGFPSGRLRISAPTSFGRLHVAPHLPAFMAAYPQIAVELDLSDGLVDLMADRIDVAIRIGPAPASGLAAQRLASNDRLLCAAPAYLDRHGAPRTLDELGRHRLLAATSQMPWRLEDGGGRPAVIQGESHVRTNSSEVVRELALAGAGIALRSTWDVADALADGRLVRILPRYRGVTDIAIHAVWLSAEPVAPAIGAFVAFQRQRFSVPPWPLLDGGGPDV